MNRLFGKMIIRQKLQLGFGALILLVLSLAAITVHNNLAVRQDYQLLADDSFTAVRSLAQAELKAARTVKSTSEMVHIVLQAYRNAVEAGGAATDTATLIAHLEPGVLDAVKAEAKEQQDGLRQYLQEFSRTTDRFHAGGKTAGDKAVLDERDRILAKGEAILAASAGAVALIDARADLESILAGNEKMEEVDSAFFSTVDDEIAGRTALLSARRDGTEGLINKSTETLLGFAALAILIGLGVGLFIADQIATPVSKLRDAVMQFGAGDFGAAETLASIKSTDEVGDLVAAFRKMAADLDAANAKLARGQRLSMLGQVAGTVSHELRNPLGAIRASLAVFRKLCADKGLGVERALERAERSVTRCDGIIGDLLEYTRAREMARAPVAFDDWIGAELDDHDLPPTVTLRRELSSGCTVAIDGDRFRQILINLVDNAAQAMTDAGWTPPEGRERVVTVRTEAAGPHCRLSVIDTGPGIPAEALPQIFEPLFTTKSFGVGLGLPTVQKIVEQHGGTIDVARTGPEGTEFVVWIPRQQADQETPTPSAAHRAA
jgi:signal transduction histidine kinase